MLFLYRTIIWFAIIAGSPYLLLKALIGRHGIKERFGFIEKKASIDKLFWFHAASVGELKIISSVLPLIEELDKNIGFAISTTTMTGKKRAAELFGDKARIFLQPLELKSAVRRVIERLEPMKLIVIETELWPLMLSTASSRGVEFYLINARMGKSSFKKYKLAKIFFSPIMEKFAGILAQSAADADRFRGLGARNVFVTGNLKYDQVLAKNVSNGKPLKVRDPRKFIFVAGSIRKGEDEIMADVISRSAEVGMNIGFILAPRHMNEVGDVALILRNKNIRFGLRSAMPDNMIDPDSVLLVDTMGELRDFYNIADMAFVGGSLVPIGGHDPLEPAALSKPVLFGPHMENSGEAAETLLKSGGALRVFGKDDIIKILEDSCKDRNSMKIMGAKCREAILSMSGASRKVAQILTGKPN